MPYLVRIYYQQQTLRFLVINSHLYGWLQDADKEPLQDDLTKLIKWSEKWQMLFNFDKFKCTHGNVSREYFMGNTILHSSVKRKGPMSYN